MIRDWSNPDPGTSPLFLGDFLNRYYNWKKDLVPWPLNITRWHNNQFVPLHCLIQLRTEPCGSQKFGGPLLSLLPFPYSIQIAILLILFQLVYPHFMLFLFTNDSKRLNVYKNYSGELNIVTCERCMLSSCLTPQYNVCSLVVLKHPPYLMIPVTVPNYWYDNYGLAVLQQLQDLM